MFYSYSPHSVCVAAAMLLYLAPESSEATDTSIDSSQYPDAKTQVYIPSIESLLAEAEFGESGDLILQVYLRDIFIADAIFARVNDSRIYLPLGELAGLLDFPILVDVIGGTASGWYLNPNRTFNVNLPENSANIDGEIYEIPSNAILADDFDLFVDSQLIEEWLPLSFDFSLNAQRLTIRSEEPFPEELARARAARTSSTETVFAAVNPYTVPAYRLLDWPSMNLTLGSYISSELSAPNYDYSLRAMGDLAFLNGTLSASGTNNSVDSLRLILGRSDPSGMLGPLQIADFQIGDTAQFLPGLVGSSLSGRGLRFGNTKLSAKRDFDNIDLQGELIAGYEVELYVNNRLQGVVRNSDDLQYRFEDVPLRSGQNEIRLEFYGPQGQRNTEIDRSFVGVGQNRRNQFNYEFSMLQPQRAVFEDILDEGENDQGKPDQLSSALEVSYGLSRRATVGVTFASLAPVITDNIEQPELLTDNLSYINARLTTDLFGSLLSYDLTSDDNNNLAGALRWRTRRSDYDFAASQIIYGSDFRRYNDRNRSDSGQLPKTTTNASMSRAFRQGLGGLLSWGTDLQYSTTQSHRRNASGSLRVDYLRSNIGSSWEHSYSRNLDLSSGNSSGNLGFNIRPGTQSNWRYRGDLDYVDTEKFIQRASLGVSTSIGQSGGLSLGVTRDLPTEKSIYTASWSNRYAGYQFTSSISGSSSDDISLRLGVSLALQRYPGKIMPRVTSNSVSSPRVAAVVFIDENTNGIQDPDEEVLEGVRLTRNGLPTKAVTDERGYAVIESLSATASADIGLIAADIDDPTLQEQPLTMGILPRPGALPVVYLPLLRTIDVEGTVTVGGETPAPNVRLILRPTNGDEPLEVFTEFDGVYYLSGVPQGGYSIGPDEEQLRSAGLYAVPEFQTIHDAETNSPLEQYNFNLKRGFRLSKDGLSASANAMPSNSSDQSVDSIALPKVQHTRSVPSHTTASRGLNACHTNGTTSSITHDGSMPHRSEICFFEEPVMAAAKPAVTKKVDEDTHAMNVDSAAELPDSDKFNLTRLTVNSPTGELNSIVELPASFIETTSEHDQQLINKRGISQVSVKQVLTIPTSFKDRDWILAQDSGKFTVQYGSSPDHQLLVEDAQSLEAEGPIAIYAYKKTPTNRPVYGLAMGVYDSLDAAAKMIAILPVESRTFQPWIRPLNDLQKQLKNIDLPL